ncbi:hypothetical protein Tco_1530619 [Tanacetum coccineum]
MDLDEFEAPQSLEQAPPSPDYVPGPEYPEYLAPSDDEISVEDQPLLADASPTALSSGYVVDSDPLEEDPEEEEEEDSSEDDDDEEEEEASEEDQKEEHLAPVDSIVLPAIDLVPSAEETEPFETDESGATPPPPHIIVLVSMTRLHRARISVRPYTPPSPSIEALIAEYASASTPSSPPPSSLSPPFLMIPSPPLLLPPSHTSPTYASAPVGYRAVMVQLIVASPSTTCLRSGELDSYCCWTDRAYSSSVMTAIEDVNKRVTDLATTQRQDAYELYVCDEDAQDDRALLRAQISLLMREKDRSMDLEALIRTREARTIALEA